MSPNTPQSDGIPTLPGFIEECTEGVAGPPAMLLRVWCRWCCRWHQHGLAGMKAGDTANRGAHCYAPDSPYKVTDYNIVVSGIPYGEVRKTMRSATATQERAIRDGRISETVQKLRDQPDPVG